MKPGEVIHHIDHDRANDDPSNLMKLANQAEHQRNHPEIVEARRSAAAREKMSAAHKGRHPSDETRARMSASQKGRTHSPETRAKISALKKGTPSPQHVLDAMNAARLAKHPRRPDRKCVTCGDMFRPPNRDTLACSRRCGATYSWKLRRQTG